MVESKSVGKTVFSAGNAILLTVISVVCILPIIHVIMSSFSDPEALALSKGLVLWPKKFSLIGYREVLKSYTVWNGYWHTLLYVSVQTLLGAQKSDYASDYIYHDVQWRAYSKLCADE